jgi:HlyD family secretion protein
MHRFSLSPIAGAIALIALCTVSCSKKSNIALETAKVERADISEAVTATGTVESVTQVDVGTQVTGIVDKLYADYNSVVTKGQLIAEIEKTLLESELKSANAEMESARLTYEYNKTNYERDRKLHDKQLISDYEYETSLKEYKVSKNAYEKAQADRVRAAKNLNYAEIYSPIDGVVISREVEVGQTVVSSMNVQNLYVIADLDNMQVVANVDEADIGQVKMGQKATFTVDAYPDEKFEGTVTQVRLNPTTESNVVTYEVIINAPNPEHKLIPGLTANISIYVTEENGVLTVPNRALKFTPREFPEAKNLPEFDAIPENTEADKSIVWVLRNNRLTPVAVTLGQAGSNVTQIVSGLNEGDTVALSYDTAEAVQAEAEEQTTEQSPFAPTPPGKKK